MPLKWGIGERGGRREDRDVEAKRGFFFSCFLIDFLACLFSGAEEKIRLKSQERMKQNKIK